MSLDFKVNQCYSFNDLNKSLFLSKFMSHYSFWSNGSDVYIFHHLPFKYLKIKYELHKIVYQKYDCSNCFSPARLGI